MALTPGDHVIDRRTGERLSFSCWQRANWLPGGIAASCLAFQGKGVKRVRKVPKDKLRKVKR